MVLHIYNPEHDIALARNSADFTPPKAARQTRSAYCHIPVFWASDGDWIAVSDTAKARKTVADMAIRLPKVEFVTPAQLASLREDDLPERIEPWGWDKRIVAELLKCNPLFAPLMPDERRLDDIRRMSSRRFAAEHLLPLLVGGDSRMVGEMTVMEDGADDVVRRIGMMRAAVVKSPWSCSGRGVRFIGGGLDASEEGWIRNTLKEQGCIMVEPHYDKLMDFAMEFMATSYGTEYLGLNIFNTQRGHYLHNETMSERDKHERIEEHVGSGTIDTVRRNIVGLTSNLFRGRYEGPFGIDMMVVASDEGKQKVHPCVEMNLRRTMGHISSPPPLSLLHKGRGR